MPRSSEEKSRGRCLLDQVGHRVADLLVLRPVLHLALSEKKTKKCFGNTRRWRPPIARFDIGGGHGSGVDSGRILRFSFGSEVKIL